jgi:hypothetical protein
MRPLDILSISLGILAIVFGFVADSFYPGLIRRSNEGVKPLPRWFGRMWFFLFGLAAISNGVWHWI